MLMSLMEHKAAEERLPLHTVCAEALHLAILEGLFAFPQRTAYAFQGGTSIHLLHGGYRFSEDLDFAGEHLSHAEAARIVNSAQREIEKHVIQLFEPGHHHWKLGKAANGRRIYTVWYSFQPQGKNLKFRVKIEFAQYPVYHRIPLPLRSNFDLLQRLPLVVGLSAGELMAEKITAVAGREYVKGRDLFDLWYFREVLRTPLDAELVQKKFRDYSVKSSRNVVLRKLNSYPDKMMIAEMSRFLPLRYRQMLEQDGYRVVRSSAFTAMQEALSV